MRYLNSILALLLSASTLLGQNVVSQRTAELVNGMYTITGTATIDEYDDGSVTFTLSDDFLTPRGPDVRVYLNDQLNATNAVELVNLSTMNHFSGGLTVDVPAGTDLDVKNKIVFYCYSFAQLWATGQLGDPVDTNPMPMDTCEESLIATYAWITEVNLCTSIDGDTAVFVQNNIGVLPGDTYAFLLTDTNETVLEVVQDSLYTFTENMTGPLRFYGISYLGELNALVGQHRLNTTATDCFIHSGDNIFLTVNPTGACPPSNVNEQFSETTKLYPNPTTGRLNIVLPEAFTPNYIVVYDMQARPVMSRFVSTFDINLDVASLAKGRYVLVATDENGQQVSKSFTRQ